MSASHPVRLAVPSLWCPVPEALHPAWPKMEEAAVEWMHKFHLAEHRAQAQRFAAIGAGELGARVTARAVDIEHAQFGVDNLLWLFAFDDTFCDEGAFSHDPSGMAMLVADLLRTAETGRPRSDRRHPRSRVLRRIPAFMAALADLRRRLDGLGSPVQSVRWVNALYAYLFYQVWEAGHRAAGTKPDLASYMTARISNGSMPVCVAWLDVANGYEVPDMEMQSPAVRALSEMCCAMVGYDNDIMSHWKESLRIRDGINLIDVLAGERQTSPDQVLAEAVAIRDRVLTQYLRVRDHVLPTVTERTRRYLGDLDAWIRGNLDWGMRSHRYRNPGNSADLPAVAVADSPTCTDTIPVPGVTHWWELPGEAGSRT